MKDKSLEKHFDAAMRSVYENALKRCGYTATYFKNMLEDQGGLQTAKTLLHKPGLQYGFEVLWECCCLDITMEALILNPPWNSLFTEEEKEIARKRLRDCGYPVD